MMAASEVSETSQILLKRIVVAKLDGKKLLLNMTWVNRMIILNESCNCSCSCNGTCPSYSTDVTETYNESSSSENLRLMNVRVYNENFSYTFQILAYQAKHNNYNLTVVTRIMPLNNTNLFTTMVNVDPRDDKSQPVADVIFFENKTTLADHYRFVGKVLNDIRKKDNTSWIWNKVRVEFNDLARKVERDLPEYNIKGFGSVWVVDDECTAGCGPICGMSSATICLLFCAAVAENPVCDILCALAMGGACGAACDYWCTGNINPCDAGCGAFCAGVCSGICQVLTSRLGVPELTYFCEKYACVPACTGSCEAVC